ncbi:MAG: DUF459 domain-containing protein [Dehalococcoidia bacterium]
MATTDYEPESEEQGAFRPQRVLWVIVVALVMAVLLNAPELEKEAKQKPFGTERDIWVAIWKPFSTVSQALYLDKPREWADQALNRDDRGSIFELPGTTATPEPTLASKNPSTTPEPTATPTPPAQLVRTPSVEEPLRLWVGGDSMSKVLGESVVRQATESGLIDATAEPQLESGLTRPDFYDWPGEFNRLAREEPGFEVFVVMFGANDAQGIVEPDGTIHQESGTPEWNKEYRRRVAGVMDLLKADNRLVVWVGQPIMRSDALSAKMQILNSIYKEEAAKRPWVKFLDLWPLFTTANGTYDAYIADDDGEVKLMRNPDGVHLVRDGGDKAARAILSLVLAEAKVP